MAKTPAQRGERGSGGGSGGGLPRDDRQLGEGGRAGAEATREARKRIPRDSTARDDADFHGPGVITGRNAEDLKAAAVQ